MYLNCPLVRLSVVIVGIIIIVVDIFFGIVKIIKFIAMKSIFFRLKIETFAMSKLSKVELQKIIEDQNLRILDLEGQFASVVVELRKLTKEKEKLRKQVDSLLKDKKIGKFNARIVN